MAGSYEGCNRPFDSIKDRGFPDHLSVSLSGSTLLRTVSYLKCVFIYGHELENGTCSKCLT